MTASAREFSEARDLPGEHLLADKVYDSDRFRNTIAARAMMLPFLSGSYVIA